MPVGRRPRVVGVMLSAAMSLSVLAPVNAAAVVHDEAPASTAAAEVGPAASTAVTESAALAEARRTGDAVEVTSLRSETTEVFATADGHLEAREHLRPVRARVKGEWKATDTSLIKSDDGMVAPKVATIGLEFSGGGDTPLVRMTKAGRTLALSWPDQLPAPALDGDTATYRDVLPDVDLRLEAQEDGFTQLLVVKTAEAAASEELAELRLQLDAEGLSIEKTDLGGLEALDKGAQGAVFEAPQPMMWDSSPGAQQSEKARSLVGTSAAVGEEGEPGAAESGKLAPVAVEVSSSEDELVLKPDAGVLTGEDTVYPVFIDPQWYSPKAAAWTMASKYWASSPQWKFNGDPDAGMGYCGWSYCQPYDTKRLFYRIPVSRFAGKSVLSAEFVVRNTWSASCDARGVQLWRTKDISSSTTWNSQNASGFWIDHLKTVSFAHGYEGCAAKDAEFDVKSAVQQAADKKWSTMTFGLQASSESDRYGWKRFSDDAFLRVQYNRPPPQIKMSQLTMEYGGACKKPASAPRVRTLGKLYANNVTDPDGDSVSVQFQAKWDGGSWNPARTAAKKSGSIFYISLASSIPQNKQVNWYARSYDGAQYSPWSYAGEPTACYFVYDTAVPKAPTITSGEYPASNPEDPNDPWYDGVGQYGTFEVKAADTDVTTYWYGVNGDPTSQNKITTTSGAAQLVKVLPAEPGVNFFTARAFDSAGNGSEIRTYQYWVKAGQPERAAWQLDEAPGSTTAAGTTTPRTVLLHGGATLGAEGRKGTGLHFDGTSGYADSDLTVVDTSDSFSVAAWARLDRMPGAAAIIVAQPGNHSPGFELYYSKDLNRWVFNQYTSDKAGASITRAMAATPGDAKAGEWTHLVGVYDGKAQQLRLYVNGKLAGSTAYTTAWEARRGLQLGAGSYNGSPSAFFPGTVDDLRIFDRAVTTAEAGQLHQGQDLTSGRPARAVFPLDEEAGAAQTTGRAAEQSLTLHDGAAAGTSGVTGTALTLDGTGGYAATDRPVLNTARSYTVSAWAKLPDGEITGNRTVLSQNGTYYSPFYLSYQAEEKTWSLRTSLADVQQGNIRDQVVIAKQPARPGEWAHLVAVHDATTQQIRLYVNGQLQGTDAAPKTWEAQGPVQVGRAIWMGQYVDYFPGSVDEVRLFDRPVADDEVRQMFNQRPMVKGRWKFETASGTPPVTPEASASGNDMTLDGAEIGSGWVDGGVTFDGVDDYAMTSAAPVDTSTSFTVTAWAQAAAIPQSGVSLLSAPGTTQSAFTVRYEPSATPDTDSGRWRIAMAAEDSTASTIAQVDNGQFFGPTDWTHLAVVYDGFAKQLSLYVNGELEEVACADADGDGTADDAVCTDRISWATDVLSFKTIQPLQLGRAKTEAGTWGEYWPGAVSDVWAFQGALTDAQIAYLAVGQPGMDTDVPDGS
ncbi:LamG-like jellyroll fold domain-containing protein [Streptomyces minutiscleroticus]|uniref:LamG-like jellyroll fold domain-containing protein n=1 Tax=Streptomyces minutiscleroticus TaxID=68238 RepID=UPI00167EC99E|nr:LamG-like jellyroll fold domain-containing protein [Streptomyces minutiscleroticus]